MPIPVLVDTDLGTDPDDLLALLTIAADPALELVAVTTCYGDTSLRADLASGVLSELGVDVPLGVGPRETMSGAEVWLAGNERHHAPAEPGGPYPDSTAVIREAARAHPDLVVAAIGPLTNLATALAADPALATTLGRAAVMGGNFADPEGTEHNFRSDAVATRAVLASGLRLDVIGIEQTRRVRITRDEQVSWWGGSSLAERLHADAHWWMSFHDEQHLLAHDPLALLTVSRPELFTLTGAQLEVSADSSVHWRPDPGSRVRVVTDLAVDELHDAVVSLVHSGLR